RIRVAKAIILQDDITGFGVRIQPSGTKAFIVNYRSGDGGRKAPNKRVVLGRYGPLTADKARKMAHEVLGKVAGGDDPAEDRADARGMPTLGDVFEQYMAANPNRSKRTNELYRYEANRYLGDWLSRPLDAISRADVEARFNSITADHGWSAANRAMSLLRSIYRRPCVDHDGLRNPVDLWLAGGGKFHRKARRKISAPAEVLPCWRAGIEAEVNNPAIRHALWFGLYTGMRRDEVLTLRWERVDMDALTFRVEETKTGVPLELPITSQLAAILERRRTAAADLPEGVREWVFPSQTSATGHVQDPHHLYARISKAGGAKFWFHGLRNSFITVAERELMLPPSLTKRLVNHARPNDVTQGYAADWTIAQLREPAQRIADRIEALLTPSAPLAGT
ncbi:MAG: integrase arm-type DNA-binding domain-containing protein, partial [Gammaproteobacteria bacterium]|nr:integrase arm-type DNA-binding domain-containing protein [Gammaproteobacteria bacterium]